MKKKKIIVLGIVSALSMNFSIPVLAANVEQMIYKLVNKRKLKV